MIKRHGVWMFAAASMLFAVAIGCEEKPGAFREAPEDGPPPMADMPDPGDPAAATSDNVAPPPPAPAPQ